jgi:hypothetical protein
MQDKWAYAVSVAAAVALCAGCSRDEEGDAACASATSGAPQVSPASDALVVRTGHGAPLTGGTAHLGSDNEKTNKRATDFRAILTKPKKSIPDVILYGRVDAIGHPFKKSVLDVVRM